METEYVFSKPFSVILGSRSDWNTEHHPALAGSHLVFYTDGSRMGSSTGYGVFSRSPRTEICGSLGTHCTVFQAEIYAICICAMTGLEKGYFNKHILILSDSQAALKALDSNRVSSKLVWECLQSLTSLASRNFVELRWVPGHQGIEGNEGADSLAKEGAQLPFFGPEPSCGISRAAARTTVRCWAGETQHRLWRQLPGQHLGKLLVKRTSPALVRSLIHMKREQLRIVTGLITGHGHVLKHLKTVGLYDGDHTCRLCGEFEETAHHVVLECEALGARRRRLFEDSPPGSSCDTNVGIKVLSLVKGTELGRRC